MGRRCAQNPSSPRSLSPPRACHRRIDGRELDVDGLGVVALAVGERETKGIGARCRCQQRDLDLDLASGQAVGASDRRGHRAGDGGLLDELDVHRFDVTVDVGEEDGADDRGLHADGDGVLPDFDGYEFRV